MTTEITTTTDTETARKAAIRAAYRNAAGLRLPTGPTGDDELDAAIANYRRLDAEHRQARAEVPRLEEARKQAVEQDKQTWANALVEDPAGKDPGTRATDKADAALTAQRRKVDALTAAIDKARGATLALAYSRAGAVRARAEAEATRALTAAAAALEALADAIDRHTTATALARWADSPDGKGYSERPIPTALLRPNDTPYTAAELVGAIRGALR